MSGLHRRAPSTTPQLKEGAHCDVCSPKVAFVERSVTFSRRDSWRIRCATVRSSSFRSFALSFFLLLLFSSLLFCRAFRTERLCVPLSLRVCGCALHLQPAAVDGSRSLSCIALRQCYCFLCNHRVLTFPAGKKKRRGKGVFPLLSSSPSDAPKEVGTA